MLSPCELNVFGIKVNCFSCCPILKCYYFILKRWMFTSGAQLICEKEEGHQVLGWLVKATSQKWKIIFNHYCQGINKNLRTKGVLISLVPFYSTEWYVGWGSVDHLTVEGAPNKRLQQVSGPRSGGKARSGKELSQSGENRLQACPSSSHKEASVGGLRCLKRTFAQGLRQRVPGMKAQGPERQIHHQHDGQSALSHALSLVW